VSAIADNLYLDQLKELADRVEDALIDIEDAFVACDVDAATACARRLLAIGLRFGDVARTQP
jgi:hypothetical protein